VIWWLKARAVTVVLGTVLATVVCGLLAGDAELPIPILTGQSGRFLVGHLITVLPAAALMYGMARTDFRVESVAVRPMNGWNAVLGVGAAAAGVTAAGVLYAFTHNDIAVVLARNTLGYIGVALITASFFGPRVAASITATVPLLCAATGWAQGGRPEPWAWILQPGQSISALAAAAMLLLLGTVITLARSTSLRRASS
jgi:hypothetical protein